jgi:Flp pilus assembly protein TadG
LDQGRIRKNAPGQIFVLMCFALFVLLAFVGLAIDLGQAYLVKTTLSKAVDAAALTAMRNVSNISGRQAIATNAFNANYSTVPGLGTPPTPSVVFSLDANGNTIVTISATAPVPTSFIRIFGYNTLNVSASATALRNPLVMSLILDRSGSMNNNGGAAALPTAVSDFINFFDNATDNVADISFSGADSVDVKMTTNFTTPVTTAVESMPYRGGTYAYGGLLDGENQILSKPLAPNIIRVAVFFTDGYANTINDPNLNCTGTAKKPVPANWNYGGCAYTVGGVQECGDINTVFFMNTTTGDWTDGKPPFNGNPNTCPNVAPGGTPGTFPATGPGVSSTTNAANITLEATYRTEQLATRMRDTDKITIYSIGLGTLINKPYLLTIANDPGSPNPDSIGPQGEAAFAPDASQLDTVFQVIASKILLRISQ